MTPWLYFSSYALTDVLYIVVTCFAFIQGIKIFPLLANQYSRGYLILYHCLMVIAMISAILYSFTDSRIFGSYFYTKLLNAINIIAITIVCLIFYDYLLSSLYMRFISKSKQCYLILRKANKILLVSFTISTMLIIISIIYEHSDAIEEYGLAFYMGSIMLILSYILIGILIICTTVIYFKELRRYPMMLENTKTVLTLVIVFMILSIFIYIISGVMVMLKAWNKIGRLSHNNGVPYTGITSSIRLLICNVAILFIFTLYFRKDIEHLLIIITIDENTTESLCDASFIEDKLAAYFKTTKDSSEQSFGLSKI